MVARHALERTSNQYLCTEREMVLTEVGSLCILYVVARIAWFVVLLIAQQDVVKVKVDGKRKAVVITGCDSGFGKRLVHDAIAKGFHVIAVCYTEEACENFLGLENIAVVRADLTTKDGIEKVVACVEKCADQLWALVNNAGKCFPGNVDWLHPDYYEQTMDINFHAPVRLTYELLPLLKKSHGRVVNVTSVDGIVALPSNAAYNASKHALEAFSDTLRCEMLPWGVKVVVVEPATMRTPIATQFADTWLKLFTEAAAQDRCDEYGMKWSKKQAKFLKDGIDNIAADPQITVEALSHALVSKNPPTRMLTGWAAHLIFAPLSKLPDQIRDQLLYRMSFHDSPL